MKETQHPPVTVLMPAYNAAAYICEAIDSVLAQTFTDFELLIINDGSTDGTEAIIRSYADARIRLYTQENRGVIGALNYGLELARGMYIARFDADDICYSGRLAVQYEFMQQHPEYVIMGSDADYVDQEGHYIFTFNNKAYEDGDIRTVELEECPFIHSSVMFVKQAVIDAGGYDPHALTFEDHILWCNLARYGKMKNLATPLIQVRFNPASVTIDEKWRGKEFHEIKVRSVKAGFVTEEDGARLAEIIRGQDFRKYKEAAYYSMIGKKYLWNQHQSGRARTNLRKAITAMPTRREPYILFLLSFLPESVITRIYQFIKK